MSRGVGRSSKGEAWRHRDPIDHDLHGTGVGPVPEERSPFASADRHELGEVKAMALVLLHVADDEPEVRGHESLGGGLISLLREPGEALLLGGIGDQRELLDVEEILIEG